MDPVEYIGLLAGALVAVSLLPQVIKSYKTKSTTDISLAWTLLNLAGQILWLVYGTLIHSISLIVATVVATIMTVLVLSFKLKFG